RLWHTAGPSRARRGSLPHRTAPRRHGELHHHRVLQARDIAGQGGRPGWARCPELPHRPLSAGARQLTFSARSPIQRPLLPRRGRLVTVLGPGSLVGRVQCSAEKVVVAAPGITLQRLDGRQAAAHEDELQAVHREVYGEAGHGAFAGQFRVWRRQHGFVLAEARHGDYLVGLATGMPLRPSTSWWKDLTAPLPAEVTT